MPEVRRRKGANAPASPDSAGGRPDASGSSAANAPVKGPRSGTNAARAPATALTPAERPRSALLIRVIFFLFAITALSASLLYALPRAYDIRMEPVRVYGSIIHEFDPWFNFRATQYLSANGWKRFFTWFDKLVWYPLGRPVGTTIYPGMQFTAVGIHRALRSTRRLANSTLPSIMSDQQQAKRIIRSLQWSLNDVCVYSPAWFGAIATALAALLAYEASGSVGAACIGAAIMAILPAHLMRSMAGGFDNECMAVAAMLLVFWTWVRSLRSPTSWPWGLACGVAYGYMASMWGGYVFVLNMVAVHAAVVGAVDWLVVRQWREGLFRSYILFFIVGTFLATRVPVVSYAPLQSLEQVSAVLVFLTLCAMKAADVMGGRAGMPEPTFAAGTVSWHATGRRVQYLMAMGVVLLGLAAVLAPSGYFGPLSARVRGLFVKHTRTGNPLVDSVAEHRPASEDAIHQYLWEFYNVAHYGAALLCFNVGRWQQGTFLLTYAAAARYFMLKMSRLVLLAGPITAILSGVALGFPLQLAVEEIIGSVCSLLGLRFVSRVEVPQSLVTRFGKVLGLEAAHLARLLKSLKLLLSAAFLVWIWQHVPKWGEFEMMASQVASSLSSPRIMYRTQTRDGRTLIVDDYYQAYKWLKENTPKDARVMAWWDYGYQITGIGERTSIADGNTWNHEHIATLGKILTSPIKKAHSYARHLADYVLVWAGGSGDDVGKSIHPARIGHSVYRDHCGDDPTCQVFGMTHHGPMPRLEKSLLYRLVKYPEEDVRVDDRLFKLVHTSKYGKVKIYEIQNVSQASKEWVADPANRLCDEGGWYCPGQYPPAPELQALLAKRRHFGQVEDFNRKEKDEAYHAEYMRRMQHGG